MTRRAFTQVELMVVVVILMLVGSGLMAAFMTGQSAYLSGDISIQVQEEMRKALDGMVKELREAGSVVPSNDNRQLDFKLALGYNQINTAGCPEDDVCWGARDQAGAAHADWTIRYRVDGTQLVREVYDAGTPPQRQARRVIANLIDSEDPIFAWDADDGVVTIGLQVQANSPYVPGGAQSLGVTTRVRLRNS
jgi:hypothetical protein